MTIHLAGDSTLAPGPLDGSGVIGWGGVLAEFVEEPVANRAIGGATTDSFVAQGRWQETIEAIAPGDTVILGFGHNDQKLDELAADGRYTQNLTGFVEQVRERSGLAVLTTSVERLLHTDDGALRASHGGYPRAVRRLGRNLEVPVIELTAFTRWLYTWLGDEAGPVIFPHGKPDRAPEEARDTTHFGLDGARAVAGFVAENLRAIRGLDDDGEPLGRWVAQP
ncbi:GDSL-type esterase/lipase family protein [Ruania suaedae]|uniref:GDSL-type esterase/lipase family protein n=1 Tax=Ruania suaedae TaxID=2897774 RepID=UPI001E4F491A|nr:GDSL-type esterase/lipase family protein [Ruania suaedae]UFU03681.1 GDSL-type esterase/lipase family protein [Ruania suaedae]